MQVVCPMCSISFPSSSGNIQTCPACMHSFELKQEQRLPSAMSLEVQGPLGEALGRFDLYELRQMIYAGQLTGKEVVRSEGTDWQPIYEVSELLQMFELVGIDLVAIQLSSQRVQGWRKDVSATEKKRQPKKKPGSKEPLQQRIEAVNSEGLDPKKILALGALMLVFLWILWGVFSG